MDLDQIEKSVIDLESYPLDKWNPKLCQNVSFRINGEGKWFYNESEIKRIAMVKLFSKLIKYEGGKYFVVTPSEKISLKFDGYECLSCRKEIEVFRQGFCKNCFFRLAYLVGTARGYSTLHRAHESNVSAPTAS